MYVVDQSNFDFSSHELCQGVNMAWQFTFPTSERSRLSPTSKNFGKYFSSFKNIILNQGPLNQAMGDWGQEKHYIKHYQITQRTQIIGSVHSCNLHWFKIWSSGGTICIVCKVGHKVASLHCHIVLNCPIGIIS